MGKKLTTEEKQKAMAWFRKNELPLLEGMGARVQFTVEDELDDEGKVYFRTLIIKTVEGITPPTKKPT